MKRTPIRLADGRELIYFDERDDADRGATDRRDMPPRPPLPEMRHDPVLDEWVSVNAARQTRPFLPATEGCPLCPSTPDRSTEIPAYDYDVVVFENQFPSFANHEPPSVDPVGYDGGLVAHRVGGGRCEVVCFTSDHNLSFAGLAPERVRTVVEAWADRTAELSAMDDVEQVFCFENRGEEIGVTLHHPHGQIYGYPFVTPRTARALESARRHASATGGNLFADLLAAERAAGERVVASNEHWTAFVPAFARWPFEVHVYPHRRVPDIPALSDAERDAFGPLYLDVLRRLDGVFELTMPYVAGWHQAPVRAGRELGYLHLELFSTRRAPNKLKYPAGSESAMGAFVSDVRPEEAARMLRGES
jgi:UDPglucose--hexose-1-phosphate uridylyltransferase